jgi:hypothetical protein
VSGLSATSRRSRRGLPKSAGLEPRPRARRYVASPSVPPSSSSCTRRVSVCSFSRNGTALGITQARPGPRSPPRRRPGRDAVENERSSLSMPLARGRRREDTAAPTLRGLPSGARSSARSMPRATSLKRSNARPESASPAALAGFRLVAAENVDEQSRRRPAPASPRAHPRFGPVEAKPRPHPRNRALEHCA